METEINFFTEGIASDAMFEGMQSDFYVQHFNHPEPEDEEDEEDKDDDKNEDTSSNSTNDDPPLDKDVVHSPVTTKPGGLPKSK